MMKKILFACSLILLACGCERESTPQEKKPEPPAGLQQKIESLNINLEALKTFSDATARSAVREMTDGDNGVELLFGDGTRVTLACDASATGGAPLIGVAGLEGVNYWTLASLPGQPWLKDAAGERMPLSGPLPVVGVDPDGFWTVSTVAKDAPWRITDAAGNAVAATGTEAVVLLHDVTLDNGRVQAALNGGGELSAKKITDLSAAATSNCYVVSTPGVYVFDASVRGNGVGDEATTGFGPRIDLVDGMTADWLWTDAEGLVSEVSLDKAMGEIAFTLGQGEGNALIALIADGAVVWSWHIWATDAPQTMAYENGVVFLDRSLGAVDTTPGSADAYGLYYQWGRKDPFYGGEKTETSSEAFLQARNNTQINPSCAELSWAYAKNATTAADAAAHPLTFYNAKVGSGNDWLAAPKLTLWGAAKTLNDPCPAGYKVPGADAWTNLDADHNYIDAVSVWDGTSYGMTYTYNGQTTWYPAQGYRMYSSGSIVGLRGSTSGSGAYWSSKASVTTAYYLFFRSKISVGSINSDLNKDHSYGYLVRCCKE